MPYTYLDYEVEQRYCTILTPTVGNIEIEASPTEYTNQNVTVKITYPYTQGIIREYSENGTEWKQTDEYRQEVMVEENKTIYARTLNESGIITEEKQLEITNIDKEKPTVEVSPSKTKYTVIETDETVDLNITIKAQDTGVSGLDKVQYAWVEEGNTPSYIDFTNEITINKTNLKIGTYYLYLNVTDKAGNKAEIEQIRYIVEYQEPVAQIGDTKYLTIQEAVEACSKTAGETQTTIEILKSTDEEFSTYEGQNIILDLKGHTIGSSNPNTPICTNNGTLQIVDTSTEKTGKIENLNGTGIENKGTLTIGDNSTEIEMEVPIIYGKQIGIKNEGTFNFYDGKIQGTAPIQGNVTNTPEEYGPVSTGYEDGITTIQLGVVSGYEARIEWVYYTTVQGAVDAAKTNVSEKDRETVTIIKNIQLKEILEINLAKNMILDLDGYELTITEQDRVINNNGDLEVTDSSEEQTGKITNYLDKSGTSRNEIYTAGIYNSGNKKLRINGGLIEINSTGSYKNNYPTGIYNLNNGTVEVIEGTVSSRGYHCYGIYNYGNGNIEVIGGTVSSSTSGNNYNSYGIYNYGNGNIEVIGGTVSSSRGFSNYGIYNYGNGNIEVTGGTVSSEDRGIYNYGSGSIKVTGGTVGGYSGIYNYESGSIEITGGIISSERYGIYNNGSGSVEITGGTVSSEYYGIYNYGSIIIGDKEKEISKENPKIKGEYTGTLTETGYGIYNATGNVEFYNGIIQGDIALNANLTKIREGCQIESSIIGEKDSIYLVKKKNEEYIVQIEEKQYTSLQEAIDSIGEEEKTIEILKDFELNEPILFNKNIVLDLKGYTITNKYYRIENISNLKIIDTTENKEGKIEIINTIVGILNNEEGNIIIEGGTVSSSSNSSSYGIYNNGSGSIEITGGTVSSRSGYSGDSYAIYNAEENGSIMIAGGIVGR